MGLPHPDAAAQAIFCATCGARPGFSCVELSLDPKRRGTATSPHAARIASARERARTADEETR